MLEGKGFFIEFLTDCEGGKPADILAAAQTAGLSHVLVKIADGVDAFGVDDKAGDITAPVVHALRGAGIAVWGWHSVYGNEPAAEAAIAIARVQTLGLDGYVVSAGEEYEQPGRQEAASIFMTAVRTALSCPIALSSYRFPNYHPNLPWSTLLEFCDLHMPQVFWERSHNAGDQLRESKRQCDALPNSKPFIATGAAYGTPSVWDPIPADAGDFLNTARALDIPAANFFSWGPCRQNLPKFWQAIARFSWDAPVQVNAAIQPANSQPDTSTPAPAGAATGLAPNQPPAGETTPSVTSSVGAGGLTPMALPEDSYTGQYLMALNSRQAGQAAALYQPEAIFFHADKVVQGLDAIRVDYAEFFAGLPDGDFTLTKAELDGNTRYITWQLGALTGVATLVWKAGRIAQHYLFVE
jgi:hypothetical protein